MPESYCLRTPFENQCFHCSQTLLQSARLLFYPTSPLTQQKLRQKTSLFLADLKCQHCLLTRSLPVACILLIIHLNSSKTFERHQRQNQTTFSRLLLIFQNLYKILRILKKRSTSYLKYFRTYSIRKTWLLECPKAPVSEHRSGNAVFTARKHCTNLHDCRLTLFFH